MIQTRPYEFISKTYQITKIFKKPSAKDLDNLEVGDTISFKITLVSASRTDVQVYVNSEFRREIYVSIFNRLFGLESDQSDRYKINYGLTELVEINQ